MRFIETNGVSRFLVGVILLSAPIFGQSAGDVFDKAPPDIDEALRSRVTKFYQLHVEGKFRAADEFVAEDSKDNFFMADKNRCRSFQILKVNFTDNFTHASAVVACDTDLVLPIGAFPVKMPLSSKWKIVDSQWMWYVDPISEKGMPTPIGINDPPDNRPKTPGQAPPGPPVMPPGAVDLESVSQLVAADKQQVTFDPSTAGEQRVVVKNGMPGGVSLTVDPERLPGFELSLDRSTVEQGQSATLFIRYKPAPGFKPAAALVNINVNPILKTIPIQIRFASTTVAPQLQ